MLDATLDAFNEERGFGFVTVAGLDRGVFVHISAFQRAGFTKPPPPGTPLKVEVAKEPQRERLRVVKLAAAMVSERERDFELACRQRDAGAKTPWRD